MNFQVIPVCPPVRVLVTNPLTPTAQMFITKLMCGMVMGKRQPIDLILLLYSNEVPQAEIYKKELRSCGFVCLNSITISSTLPNYTDADVFCFITTLRNPNKLEYYKIDDDEFDALYLIIKIANNLKRPVPEVSEDDSNNLNVPKEVRDPLIVADGLVAMDIVYALSQNLPRSSFYCPTGLTAVATHILAEYLKAFCKEINYILVWGANDQVFHVDVLKPYILHDVGDKGDKHCDWDAIGKDVLESLKLDHTQFNESWMKKEFINKIALVASKNPYGNIFRAIEMAKTLNLIWNSRISEEGCRNRCSLGVISDGTLGTIKGCAYILPLVMVGSDWLVDRSFEENIHLKLEIKRINAVVQKNHIKLVKYCKKFLQDNVINQEFIPSDHDTTSVCTYADHSSRTSVA